MSKIFNSIIANYKAQFIPVRDEKVRCTMDGTIACPSNGEYHAFINGELTNVPQELLIDVPVYRISKPIDQLRPGDIIKTSSAKTLKDGTVSPEGKFTYRLVKSVADGKISTISFSGADSKITPVKDFFLGQKTASVVVNLFAGIAGGAAGTGIAGINPMLLMALASDGDKSGMKDMLPFLMMQGGAAGTGINPMMFLALKDGDGDGDLSDLFMMQALAGGFGANAGVNPLANLFGGVAPVAPAAPAADAADAASADQD